MIATIGGKKHCLDVDYEFCDVREGIVGYKEPSEGRADEAWHHYGFKPSHRKRKSKKTRRRARKADAFREAAAALNEFLGHTQGSPEQSVLRMTEGVFGAPPISVQTIIDPECGDTSVQISVEARGNVEQLLALNDRWHRELAALGDVADKYCLSLVPQ